MSERRSDTETGSATTGAEDAADAAQAEHALAVRADRGAPGERVAPEQRMERRTPSLRVAEIAPFPRGNAGGGVHGPRTGFALDESDSGLCLSVDAAVPKGALLRVVLRDFGGATVRDDVVRIAWCRGRERGRFALGAERVTMLDEPSLDSTPSTPANDGTGRHLEIRHETRRVPVVVKLE